jgi:hypothetical protein
MASNDPTDTGGLFIGRRPGTAPIHYRVRPQQGSAARQRFDRGLALALLTVELILCLSLFGPQPLGWMWVGSQAEYLTGYVTVGISTIMLGTLLTLMVTMVLAKRVDHWWKLVRRAGGHRQERGALERIFVIAVFVALIGFGTWFFILQGPAPSVAPQN